MAAKGKTPSDIARKRVKFARSLLEFAENRLYNLSESLKPNLSKLNDRYNFMAAPYQPKVAPFSEEMQNDHIVNQCYSGDFNFDKLTEVNMAELKNPETGMEIGNDDFTAIAIASANLPEFQCRHPNFVEGNDYYNPQLGIYSNEVNGFNQQGLMEIDPMKANPRAGAFDRVSRDNVLAPARDFAADALKKYVQNGDCADLAKIIGNELITAASMQNTQPFGETTVQLSHHHQKLMRMMERDPALRDAVRGSIEARVRESRDKLAADANKVQEKISAYNNCPADDFNQKKKLAEEYVSAKADQTLHRGLADMTFDKCTKAVDRERRIAALYMKCEEGKNRLRAAQEKGIHLSESDKREIVTDFLKLGSLNALQEMHRNKQNERFAEGIHDKTNLEEEYGINLAPLTTMNEMVQEPSPTFQYVAGQNMNKRMDNLLQVTYPKRELDRLVKRPEGQLLNQLTNLSAVKDTMKEKIRNAPENRLPREPQIQNPVRQRENPQINNPAAGMH